MAKQLNEQIASYFSQSITAKTRTLETMQTTIAQAGIQLSKCLQRGGKILACGNGGSAADAQHFSSEMLNRFERERKSLPAIALTTDCSTLTSVANDYHFDYVFARQIEGLGQAGDILLAISTSGNSPNILRAIQVAHQQQLTTIALTGKQGGKISQLLQPGDLEIRVAAEQTARIQEVHILIIHCLCDSVDSLLLS